MNINRTILYHVHNHSNKISAQTRPAQERDRSLVSEFASPLSEMRFAIIEQRQLPLCFLEVPFQEIPSPVFMPHRRRAALYLQFLEYEVRNLRLVGSETLRGNTKAPRSIKCIIFGGTMTL